MRDMSLDVFDLIASVRMPVAQECYGIGLVLNEHVASLEWRMAAAGDPRHQSIAIMLAIRRCRVDADQFCDDEQEGGRVRSAELSALYCGKTRAGQI